jgi:spermidine synthase
VRKSLADVQFHSATDLLSTYVGQASDLTNWLKGAQINTDRNLRLQYLSGMGSNAARAAEIYEELLRYRQFPKHLFVTSQPTLNGKR